MKNKFILVLMVLIPSFVYAHALLLNVFDNEDGTITTVGVFNTGQAAVGAQILLVSLINGETLYKKRLPTESELVIKIPNEPYKIVLNGGPNHQVVKEGIVPKDGFSKELLEKKVKFEVLTPNNKISAISSEPIILIAVLLAFVLLLITIIISIKNTNKLIRELQNNR